MSGIAPSIDTTNLLTILGVMAAVWAVIPASSRLSFRLSMRRWDWLVIWTIIATVHVLIFEDVLRALGAYPNLGPWRWNLDKNGAIYLLFTALAGYVFLRSRNTRLSHQNLPLFEQLVTQLLHSQKFSELGELLDRHLETVVRLEQEKSFRSRIAVLIRPPADLHLALLAARFAKSPETPSMRRRRKWMVLREKIARALERREEIALTARKIVRSTLSSRALVEYLALAHPYLCLRVMKRAAFLVDDLQDMYFEGLLASEASIFYSEIKNNDNLAEGHRLRLPPENRLLNFYLKDVEIASELGVYRSVGEAILARLESDDRLCEGLNRKMWNYQEVGKLRCPIYCGLFFFRIMVFEGLYQHKADHLWLHYVTHFTDKILKRMRPMQVDDLNHEFPTPFGYLLYQVVDMTMDWVEDAERVIEPDHLLDPDQLEGRHAYISFEAASAIGPVLTSILSAENVTDRLKDELMSVVLYALRRLGGRAHLAPLSRAVEQSIVRPFGFDARPEYLRLVSLHYGNQDYELRRVTGPLAAAIDAALEGS